LMESGTGLISGKNNNQLSFSNEDVIIRNLIFKCSFLIYNLGGCYGIP